MLLKYIFKIGVNRKLDFRRVWIFCSDLSNVISGGNWLFTWDCIFSGGTLYPSANYICQPEVGKYAEYELFHGCCSRSFLKIFRKAFSKNTAGGMLLISSDCSLKISRTPFNPLKLDGNKWLYILKQTFN